MSTTPTSVRLRAGLAAAGLTVATLGASVVTAETASAAGKARVNATIKLSGDSSDLLGKVKSPRAVCKKKVRVVLFWRKPGVQKFVTVQDDVTNRSGAWKIDAPGSRIPAGKYYVKVAGSAKCKPEKSPTITVR